MVEGEAGPAVGDSYGGYYRLGRLEWDFGGCNVLEGGQVMHWRVKGMLAFMDVGELTCDVPEMKPPKRRTPSHVDRTIFDDPHTRQNAGKQYDHHEQSAEDFSQRQLLPLISLHLFRYSS